MLAISLLRVVFDAWHGVAVDARKTKEYFEVRNSGGGRLLSSVFCFLHALLPRRLWGGAEGLKKELIHGGTTPRSKPSPFYIAYFNRKVTLSYTFNRK